MMRLFQSALVIARRDYVATVWSRSFLMFLLGPIIAGLFGGLLGGIGGRVDQQALRPHMVFIAKDSDTASIKAAYARLSSNTALADLRYAQPESDVRAQARNLLTRANDTPSLVIIGWPDKPILIGPKGQLEARSSDIHLLFDDVAMSRTLQNNRIDRPRITFSTEPTDPAQGNTSSNRHIVARAGQTVLFILTIMLAGMLLSNLVEEKSNKVIEVLAAAVPVDAIFLGKLIAMLGVSLTGIAVWSTMLAGGLVAQFGAGSIPTPAVGWGAFTALGVMYFIMNYMLLGGIFLGIGAQASTVREVQTLSMPITMAQLAIFALGSAVVNDTSSAAGLAAAAFPLSSPIVMIAHAAQDNQLWPHAVAIAWQGLWVAIIVRFAAKRFRVGVLKSGAPSRPFWRRRAST